MQETHFIDKLALIYLKDSKLLVTRSQGKDLYYLPGGKREAGENDYAALSREVLEELNVSLEPGAERYFGTFEAQAHGKAAGTLVRTTCYSAKIQGAPQASSEIEEIAFVAYADRARCSTVLQLVLDDLLAKDLLV
ncbi:DNA mismatch repair protein MutT [Ktedonobacter sp. SOSP1-52]|uniref:NUDIX hydrolase n=1 Tax=Ktedonobacter sp. SOSP1-52 TaxID=2778366 RepID=UPI0019151B69|nr:NUDIX domain-containing protein [Ktedonobacter sp. SOSP1-52]GHO67821.1 DNA mismatch repair protein MutT [Ktedonobacter sp. SOSP1-52]